ncbi:UNVERIFIED_CONTAM: hypothetical protein RF649_09425 [Kocuria sp. CPCC 205295]|uniref:alpha/beta hydrolase family protein n=1 Tax=unclassified Kocuria TaxID=2649579 RepID=UPI0034D650C1
MSLKSAVDLLIGGSSALDAALAGELYLRPSSKDADLREMLRFGSVRIGKLTLDGGPQGIWDHADPADRSTGLALNSLKFIDPLRRGAAESSDAQLWLDYVRGWGAWADDARAARLDSFLPAGQRAVVLAAGLRTFWKDPSERPADIVALLGGHTEPFRDKLRTGRVHLIEETMIRGCAAASQGPRPEEDSAILLQEFAERYLAHGLAPGGGVGAVSDMTRRWVDLYSSIYRTLSDPGDLVSPQALSERSESELSRLWIHATTPTGGLVSVGSEEAQSSWSNRTPSSSSERYCASGSGEGQPTDDLTFVNRSGWMFARRGWGETELDFHEETFFGLRSGPLESKGREHDNSALWLTARGVTWLGDNPGRDGSSWSQRDHHSSVSVEARHRTLSDAEITRFRDTAQCLDVEVRDRAFLPVAMTRRVVYSKSGDFLVAVDQVRSADAHSGRQNWIIPPGVDVEISQGAALLRQGEEACELIWLSVPAPQPEVEILDDGWQRLSVAFSAASTRLITAIVPRAAQEDVSCTRIPLADASLSISVRRPRHAEQLVIAKEGAGIGPYDEDGEILVERVVLEALNGGLTPEEEARLRLDLRARIGDVKERLHRDGADREQRRAALEDLRGAASELGVSGLRDFGLGAAMIDIAAADLKEEVSGHPLVAGRKRSPLISWDDSDRLIHEFYGVPILTTREVSRSMDPGLERQMLTIDKGQLALPFLLSRSGSGRTLRVMFHGATDRSRNALPRFERMRSMEKGSSGPVLFVSDPCLDLDSSQILTWYAGDERLNLHELIAMQTKAYADELGCDRILFVGNSGGGYAALQCATYLADAAVVTFNPQIQVDQYVPRIARTAQEVLFGAPSVADDSALASRMDLIKRYQEIEFHKRVFFIQNTGDEMHYEYHCKPFTDAWRAQGDESDLMLVTPYLGDGHRVPPPDEYMSLVDQGEAFVFGE